MTVSVNPFATACRAEALLLRVLADKQNELEIWQTLKDACAPNLRALAARRQVAAFGVETRETESHRHDRNLLRIIENLFADPEPLAQADARRIGERTSRGMDPDAGRLAGDAEARSA